jgi:hypothetical protein
VAVQSVACFFAPFFAILERWVTHLMAMQWCSMVMARWWWCQKTWWAELMKWNDRPVGKPQEKVLMNIAASFPSVKKPRFIV